MKEYDILVFFAADYLCTGSFYDSFEYFWMLRSQGYTVGFVVVAKEGRGTVLKAMKVKYKVKLAGALDDIHIHTFDTRAIMALGEVVFIPSMASACMLFNENIQLNLANTKKLVTIAELPLNHAWMKAFKEPRQNVMILRDDRIFPEFDGYQNRVYHRKLYFDIQREPRDEFREPTCMLNMVTDHKCYDRNELDDILADDEFKDIKRWAVFVKDKNWDKYYKWSYYRHDVDLHMTPTHNYMGLFSHILYLPSKREFDPSPRLLAEAKYFRKKLWYHNFLEAPRDGAFFRMKDVLEKFDWLHLTPEDPIFKILEG